MDLKVDGMVAFGLLPGGLYLILEKLVLRGNTEVVGSRYELTMNSHWKGTPLTSKVYGFSYSSPQKP